MTNLNLQYPVGKFVFTPTLTPSQRLIALHQIEELPTQLQAALTDLVPNQIDSAIRPGAWSIRTLVHHICDSHLVAYSWMRLALTEDWPLVFSYDPDRMSNLADCQLHPSTSVRLLAPLHERWVAMLASLADHDWKTRGYTHPESGRCSLDQALAMYAWHSIHHLAQIQQSLMCFEGR